MINKAQFTEMIKKAIEGERREHWVDVTPHHWPEGWKARVMVENAYDYSAEGWGYGKLGSGATGIVGDRQTGYLIDTRVSLSERLLVATKGVEPVSGYELSTSGRGRNVGYTYDPVLGFVTRYVRVGEDKWDYGWTEEESQTPCDKVWALKSILEQEWGYGYTEFPLDADGPVDAMRKARAMSKALSAFRGEYNAMGKILGGGGPRKWGGDREYRYWEADNTYDEDDPGGQLNDLLSDWRRFESYGEGWAMFYVWAEVVRPGGWEKKALMGGVEDDFDNYENAADAAVELIMEMQEEIPFPICSRGEK